MLSSVTEKHALLGSDQVTDLAVEEYPISLPRETPVLLLQLWIICIMHRLTSVMSGFKNWNAHNVMLTVFFSLFM